ncbi:MAG: PilN domain-containing protein [Syntrophobacteraceae bacterium]|jgi:general secretion pathway protein L
MLKSIIKYRPTHLYAVYVEPTRIEVLEAHRHWRSWEISPAEQFHVPQGESVFDHLQYLNLKPKGRKGSALLAIVSNVFYSVHKEHYPLTIKDHLDDAIHFDWQENIFHEHDSTLHFFGPPVALDQHVSVPIFSIQREIYDKLNQAVNGPLFHTFAVVPSALSFSALLPPAQDGGEDCEIMARSLDDDNLEIHRFYRGTYLDSMVVGKSSQSLELFAQNLKCTGNEDCEAHIHLVCTDEECKFPKDPAATWAQGGFPITVQKLSESFVTGWIRRLLKQDAIHTFDTEILLKPWEIPRIVWPLAALIFIFALYGLYQTHSAESMVQTGKRLRVQINQLETRWKPIEELQTRITKFREDQKTLSEFNREDYQLLELLNLLTLLTPDDTWLNYLSLRKGQLILRGESKSAIKYLSDLSKTDGLSDVKFASPVTRDPGTDLERFNVQLQLDMDKLKKNFETLPAEQPAGAPSPAAQTGGADSAPQVRAAPRQADEPEEVFEEAPEQETGADEAQEVPEENQQ